MHETGYRLSVYDDYFGYPLSFLHTEVDATGASMPTSYFRCGEPYELWIQPFFFYDVGPEAKFNNGQTLTIPCPDPPPAPANLVATSVNSTTIQLDWTDGPGEDYYGVSWDDGSEPLWLGQVGQNVTTFMVNDFACGREYRFWVSARNEGGRNYSEVVHNHVCETGSNGDTIYLPIIVK
jgi:hypothetical protein